MSSLVSWWIIVITVGNMLACWWLIRWTMKKRPNESQAGDVTGHVWDENLQEYNNPLPRWWLWLFYLTIIFSFLYLALYPGLGSYAGMLDWTMQSQYAEEVQQSDAKYGPIFAAFAAKPIPELAKDDEALAAGKSLFTNYCAQCHGVDAKGVRGYPNLTDDDWMYGGTPDNLVQTIMHGRLGVMPPHSAILGGEQGVDNMVAYVESLSGREVDSAKVEAAKPMFAVCAACHGPDGKGNIFIGAPNLTDNIWLHGGTKGRIRDVIANGRNGRMPAHNEFLGADKSHLLAAYVYSLSN